MGPVHKTHVLTRQNFEQLIVVGTDLETALASTRAESSQVIWAESVGKKQDLLTWNIVFKNGLEHLEYKMVKVQDNGIDETMYATAKTVLCTISGVEELTKHLRIHAAQKGLGRGIDANSLRLVRTSDVKSPHQMEVLMRSLLINSLREMESGPRLDNYTQTDIELTRIALTKRPK